MREQRDDERTTKTEKRREQRERARLENAGRRRRRERCVRPQCTRARVRAEKKGR
jgi:hypothetical protein